MKKKLEFHPEACIKEMDVPKKTKLQTFALHFFNLVFLCILD